jgi:hypothetical protein
MQLREKYRLRAGLQAIDAGEMMGRPRRPRCSGKHGENNWKTLGGPQMSGSDTQQPWLTYLAACAAYDKASDAYIKAGSEFDQANRRLVLPQPE